MALGNHKEYKSRHVATVARLKRHNELAKKYMKEENISWEKACQKAYHDMVVESNK